MSKINLKNKYSLYFLFCLSVVVLLLFSAVNISEYLLHTKILGVETEDTKDMSKLNDEKKFWEGFLRKNPTYYEGWMELANIEFSLGNADLSSTYALKAKEINPNKE